MVCFDLNWIEINARVNFVNLINPQAVKDVETSFWMKLRNVLSFTLSVSFCCGVLYVTDGGEHMYYVGAGFCCLLSLGERGLLGTLTGLCGRCSNVREGVECTPPTFALEPFQLTQVVNGCPRSRVKVWLL